MIRLHKDNYFEVVDTVGFKIRSYPFLLGASPITVYVLEKCKMIIAFPSTTVDLNPNDILLSTGIVLKIGGYNDFSPNPMPYLKYESFACY